MSNNCLEANEVDQRGGGGNTCSVGLTVGQTLRSHYIYTYKY